MPRAPGWRFHAVAGERVWSLPADEREPPTR